MSWPLRKLVDNAMMVGRTNAWGGPVVVVEPPEDETIRAALRALRGIEEPKPFDGFVADSLALWTPIQIKGRRARLIVFDDVIDASTYAELEARTLAARWQNLFPLAKEHLAKPKVARIPPPSRYRTILAMVAVMRGAIP